MQTFPGGIHSGTDFYMNDAGHPDRRDDRRSDAVRRRRARRRATASARPPSTPRRSTRWRRSCARRTTGCTRTTGPIADVKTDEAAILLLGTEQSKLWRSTRPAGAVRDAGFLWANNNAARRRGAPGGTAPSPTTRPSTRLRARGTATSPSGTSTTSTRGRSTSRAPSACGLLADQPAARLRRQGHRPPQMAEKLVFMAHQGKVTLREKFPGRAAAGCPTCPARSRT